MQIRNNFALLIALLATAVSPVLSATTFKWVNDNGVTQYGDQVQTEYQNKSGIAVNKTEPELTPEQRKAKQDAALLNAYTIPQEINASRDRDIQYITLTVGNTKLSIASAGNAIKAQQERSATFAKQKNLFRKTSKTIQQKRAPKSKG